MMSSSRENIVCRVLLIFFLFLNFSNFRHTSVGDGTGLDVRNESDLYTTTQHFTLYYIIVQTQIYNLKLSTYILGARPLVDFLQYCSLDCVVILGISCVMAKSLVIDTSFFRECKSILNFLSHSHAGFLNLCQILYLILENLIARPSLGS